MSFERLQVSQVYLGTECIRVKINTTNRVDACVKDSIRWYVQGLDILGMSPKGHYDIPHHMKSQIRNTLRLRPDYEE